ncbi:hypothetical protein PV10_00969 [Exophiala mesophila]|uniref:Pentatricopeptide repeat protein n=1 Tax=Exophiala mesophila TaxID=212818 RepID=A0A0D1X5X4_EXOME|nr:uncharacterized protein PV10_00969 [Exophiala mesophila]KIV97190.1 hypothetical protein PV10_00969 [Exophiala mesophila]
MYKSSRPFDLAKKLSWSLHNHTHHAHHAHSPLVCHWNRSYRPIPKVSQRSRRRDSKARIIIGSSALSDEFKTLQNWVEDAKEKDHVSYNTFRREISTQRPYSKEWAAKILPLFEVDPPLDARVPPTPEDLEEELLAPFQRRHRVPGERRHPKFDSKRIFSIEMRRAMAMRDRKSGPLKHPIRGPPPRRERPNHLLEYELRVRAHLEPYPLTTSDILTILIEERMVKPNERHYDAMILSCCRAETSSANDVRLILEEMRREGFELSPTLWAAVLKVMTVHPDGFLRNEASSVLLQQSNDIPIDLGQILVTALIREQQLELAWLELQKMTVRGMKVQTWVWVLLIHALCERNDLDTVLQSFYVLRDTFQHIPQPTLLAVLQHAAGSRHLDLTKLIWHTYVEPMHIKPEVGICVDALSTADHHNDLNLGESAFFVLKCTVEARTVNSKAETISSPGSADGDDRNASSPPKLGETVTPSPDVLPPFSTAWDHDTAQEALATAQTTLGRIRTRHGISTLSHEQEVRNRRGNLYAMFRLPEHEHAMLDPIVGLSNGWAWWLPHSKLTGRLRRLDGKPRRHRGLKDSAADGQEPQDDEDLPDED